ncbi:MAG: hypothetical protein LKJ80_04560 [Oscillibacter sp.]|jgi:deoxyribonucleoside regulator|nr:hypothetical protein [Oscillibacter sp.]
MEDRTELLIRAAQLYYEEGLNQNTIAGILRTSRPTVSRLLDEAKASGVVEIIVHDPIRKDPKLSYALRTKLNLRDAVVVTGSYDYPKALQRCCEAGLQLFNSIMENNRVIGITWGSVPQLLSEQMEQRNYYNVNVVQMVGCLGTGNPNVDGLELAIRMSRKMNGTYSNIYAPIYVKSEVVRDYLIQEPQIEATLRKAMHTDIILTGIGSMDAHTAIQEAGYWTDSDRMDMISRGAVGHLLSRPYDKNGNPVERRDWYVVGAPLEAMKAAEWSIGISAAEFKAEAVLGAIRGGYINTLIADQKLAQKLLELLAKTR